MDVGFVGLGAMGTAMVQSLLRNGHRVTVWNRTPEKAQPLAELGAAIAQTPADAARAGVVITMVADDAALQSVLEGEHGLLGALPSGGLHISMSTISVALSDRLTTTHADRGQGFVSAPVFGRPPAAQAGKLFVVSAGEPQAVARATPLFEAMGQRLFTVGETPSAANLVKLCGNFMILSTVESLSEAMALAAKGGVEKKALLEVLTGTIFGAPVFSIYGELIVEERFRPAGFAAPLALKDLRLVGEAADALGAPMDVLDVVRSHLSQVIEQEGADIDCSALSKAVERNAGL
ncbi:NAD(P)-dependent oxidoreductase [Phenylobacterium deserti]|uniref:NAD(P)-dependent oxidoreductase n=1 Tax=Phenylobacterium deserti TaxID=1914756 RepID=A0A328AD12_9CAUL|nr:NAD(P)-dependent oxidoreductase [Phenylobacterium deserti]RAK52541.1 NAD(P)-dependent oxidoreductase [Phenylobacterium deserti]